MILSYFSNLSILIDSMNLITSFRSIRIYVIPIKLLTQNILFTLEFLKSSPSIKTILFYKLSNFTDKLGITILFTSFSLLLVIIIFKSLYIRKFYIYSYTSVYFSYRECGNKSRSITSTKFTLVIIFTYYVNIFDATLAMSITFLVLISCSVMLII